ncbi:MAG: hypothetical protein WC740_07730 [Verrucomicrobiia bacterium]
MDDILNSLARWGMAMCLGLICACTAGCKTADSTAKDEKISTVSEGVAKKVEQIYGNVRIEGAKIWGHVSEDDIVTCVRLISSLDQTPYSSGVAKRVESFNGGKFEGRDVIVVFGKKWFAWCVHDSKSGWKVLRHGLWEQ